MRWTPLLAAPAAVIIAVPAPTERAQRQMFPGASFSPAPVQLSDADRSTQAPWPARFGATAWVPSPLAAVA